MVNGTQPQSGRRPDHEAFRRSHLREKQRRVRRICQPPCKLSGLTRRSEKYSPTDRGAVCATGHGLWRKSHDAGLDRPNACPPAAGLAAGGRRIGRAHRLEGVIRIPAQIEREP
jgi:hypothetical protein